MTVAASNFDDDFLFRYFLSNHLLLRLKGVGGFIGDLFLERPNLNTRKAIATEMAAMRKMKIGSRATIKEFALNDDCPCGYDRLSVSILRRNVRWFRSNS